MVKKKLTAVGDWIEDHLRRACGEITPDKRIIVILSMLFLFTAGSLYFTISSIYRFGKNDGKNIQIEHIERLQLKLQQKQHEVDSINHSNDFYYERERE